MIYKVNLKLEAIVPHLPLYSMGLPADNFRIFFRDAARVVGSPGIGYPGYVPMNLFGISYEI